MHRRKIHYFLLFLLVSGSLLAVFLSDGFSDRRNIAFLSAALFFIWLGRFLTLDSIPAHEGAVQAHFTRFAPVYLALIFFTGFGIRFYGLRFGLPHNFHPDEVPKVNAVLRMYNSGSLDPDYFLHPSLLLYLTYFTNFIFHKLGAQGEFSESLVLAGRTVSLVAGSLTIVTTYFLSREFFGKAYGLLAALLLSVFPIHITCSRYLKEDSLLVFFIMLTALLVAVSVRRDSIKLLLLGALASGLSGSTKYSGALACLIVAVAPWLKSESFLPDRRFFFALFPAGLVSIAGFLMATPYSILNSAKFLKDVGYESRHMQKGHTNAITGWSQYWMYHFSRSIVPGISLAVSMAALVKCGAINLARKRRELFLVFLLLLFYLSAEYVKSKPAPQPERYILPCVPFMAILAAGFIKDLIPGRLKPLVALIIISFPLKRTLELTSEVNQDTRLILAKEIADSIPKGTKFLLDFKAYGPPLDPAAYEIKYIGGSAILQELDAKRLRASGFDYLVLSSLFYGRYFTEPGVEPIARQRIREVGKYFEKVRELEPRYGSYAFHNPTLVMYKLKKQ